MNCESEGHHGWPDHRPMSGASYARVDTTISCVLTRFHLNSLWSLIPFYLGYRRVRREARNLGGLLQTVFLIENFRTCYTLSLWRDDWSIVEFGALRAHVSTARAAFRPTYRKDLQRSEIWSAQFRLWATSRHNLSWEGLDLESLLFDHLSGREEVSRTGGPGGE
jgi:hypothetical protein